MARRWSDGESSPWTHLLCGRSGDEAVWVEFVGLAPQSSANCAPDCALTRVYARQIPSVTRKRRETSFRSQVVQAAGEKVLRYGSTLLARFAFQACSFNHSDISPFRINHLRDSESSRR